MSRSASRWRTTGMSGIVVQMVRPRTVLLFALGIDQFGAGVFLPLSLVYAVQVVGLPLPTAAAAVTAGTVVGLLVPPVAGQAVERIGARWVVVIAQTVQAGGALIYLSAAGAPAVFAGAVLLAGGLQAFFSALFVLIGDVVGGTGPTDATFTLVAVVRGAAFGLGALVVGAALSAFGTAGFSAGLLITAATFLLAAAFLAVGVSTPRPDRARPAPAGSGVLRNRPYLALIAVNVLFALALDLFLLGAPVHALQVLGTPAWVPGAMLAVTSGLGLLGAPLVLRLTGRLSRPAAMRWGAMLMVLWCAASAAADLVPGAGQPTYLMGCAVLFAVAGLVAVGRVNALAEAAGPCCPTRVDRGSSPPSPSRGAILPVRAWTVGSTAARRTADAGPPRSGISRPLPSPRR